MRTPPLRPIRSPTHPIASTLISIHRLCFLLLLDIGPICEGFYRTTYKAPPHASEIIRCGQPALFSRVGYNPIVANICHLDEAWRGANSSKDTLIITFWSLEKKSSQISIFHGKDIRLLEEASTREKGREPKKKKKKEKELLSCIPLTFKDQSRRRDEVD